MNFENTIFSPKNVREELGFKLPAVREHGYLNISETRIEMERIDAAHLLAVGPSWRGPISIRINHQRQIPVVVQYFRREFDCHLARKGAALGIIHSIDPILDALGRSFIPKAR